MFHIYALFTTSLQGDPPNSSAQNTVPEGISGVAETSALIAARFLSLQVNYRVRMDCGCSDAMDAYKL